jgi:Sec-independent protein translocase protein TatA
LVDVFLLIELINDCSELGAGKPPKAGRATVKVIRSFRKAPSGKDDKKECEKNDQEIG